MNMLTANFHTHSTYCDGSSTPRQMVEKALKLGFTSLGFSGHVDIDPVMDIDAYQLEIGKLKKEYADRLEILCGGEFDMLFPEPERGGFDYKIGSNHHLLVDGGKPFPIDYSEEMFLKLLNNYFDGDAYHLAEEYYERVSRIYDRIHCTFIGHFDLITIYNNELHLFDEADPRYLKPAMDALDHLLSERVPFEINTKQIMKGRIYPHQCFLKRIRERNGEILISSDAHNAEELNRGFQEAVELAKLCGFDHVNYLTARKGKVQLVEVGI